MAARVNVKFVVILSVVLVAVMGGVVYAAYVVLSRSGQDYADRAAEFEQVGEYREAARSWERAVGHDRTRLDWLEGWLNALAKVDHNSEAEYNADFTMLRGIYQQIAETKGPDLEAHRRFFDTLTYTMRATRAVDAGTYEFVANAVERSLLSFPDSMETERGIIRRYRGIIGAMALARGSELGEDRVETSREDLLAALDANPADENALASLVMIDANLAAQAALDRRPEDAQAIWTGLAELADRFVQNNPDSIRGRIQQINIDLAAELVRIDTLGLFGADLSEARVEALGAQQDAAAALLEDYLQTGPDRSGQLAAAELTALLTRTFRTDVTDRTVEVWDHTIEQHPDDILVIFSRASFLRSANRFDQAIDTYQMLRDLPLPPVSAEGVLLLGLQKDASIAMGVCAFEQWNIRTSSATRLERGSPERQAMLDSAAASLERARGYRDQAAEELAEDRPELILLNARIAFAEGDIPRADVLARRYNETRTDPEGLRLAARVAGRLGNNGEQARLLESILEITPNDLRTMLELAEVQIGLRNYEDARFLLNRAGELRPDFEPIQNSLAVIDAALGNNEIEDPIEAAIIEAYVARNRGDVDDAIDILETTLRNNPGLDHIRVHTVLAANLMSAGELERAAAVADAGLAIDPDSRSLQIVKRQVEIGDDIDAAIEYMQSLDTLSQTEKNLRIYQLYVSRGENELAAPYIADALEAEPDNRAVILAAFEFALRTGELDQARALIARTQGQDIDGASGLTMRARLDIAEGKFDEAERSLTAAVERGSLNPTTLSLLGRVQTLQGDSIAAIESFRRAREVRPNDVGHAIDYARALVNAGRQTDALQAAREAIDIGRGNEEFLALWLALEGAVGSKQTAYDERVAISESNTGDEANTAALIQLCLDLRRFDEARERLDEAREENDSLALCRLDALWHLQRGDSDGAIRQYRDFLISDAEGADSAAAYIAFGSFLIDNGQLDAGLTTLRQGRRLQSPENPVVDYELARRLFFAGRHAEAADVLESIVQSAGEDSSILSPSRSLLIESYSRIGEWETAQARLEQLGDEERDTLTVRLLEVDIIRGLGRTPEARRLLDETISAYPNQPLPYLRRGTLLLADSALIPDAIEDFTRAIELDPANADAYRFRSIANSRLGNTGEAANDIIQATRANPLDDQLRLGAADRLIDLNREDLAADVIDEGLERQAGNLRLLVNAGRLFADADDHLKAVQYFRSAWEQTKDATVANMLIGSMLELPRPDLRAARQITSDPALDRESAPVLMMRAAIESAAENWPATRSLLTEVYTTNRENPQLIIAWANSLEDLLDGRDQALAYLRQLEAQEGLSAWARFAHARLLSQEESGRSQAREIASSIIDSTPDNALRLSALRLRSITHYEDDNHQAALDDMLAGLEIVPEDAELNNNIAYILAADLGRAEEALPYAQLAVERNPENRGMLDTLGVVYLEAGEPEKAIAPLERALTLATTDAERAPVLVHLARARLDTGNRPGAEDAANQARSIVESLDEPNETTQRELESVLDAINAR